MASTLMQQLAKYEGSCCVYSYIKSTADQDARELAEHLGVDHHTILRWRKKVFLKQVTCGHGATGLDGCENK